MEPRADLFEGFASRSIQTDQATIFLRLGGSGPGLLLLHGHPQTHVMWHRVASRLAKHFTVVATDLRGYGDSSKPKSTPDHEPYSKRAMARDQVAVMQMLGLERFFMDMIAAPVLRIGWPSIYPDRVAKLAVLDIIPTVEMWDRMDRVMAMKNWHWLFLAQPEPFPESMITRDPEQFCFRSGGDRFDPRALSAYIRAVADPATARAMCEDYRAGATFDRELDALESSARSWNHLTIARAVERERGTRWAGASRRVATLGNRRPRGRARLRTLHCRG